MFIVSLSSPLSFTLFNLLHLTPSLQWWSGKITIVWSKSQYLRTRRFLNSALFLMWQTITFDHCSWLLFHLAHFGFIFKFNSSSFFSQSSYDKGFRKVSHRGCLDLNLHVRRPLHMWSPKGNSQRSPKEPQRPSNLFFSFSLLLLASSCSHSQ